MLTRGFGSSLSCVVSRLKDTEVALEFASGESQICYTLCVTATSQDAQACFSILAFLLGVDSPHLILLHSRDSLEEDDGCSHTASAPLHLSSHLPLQVTAAFYNIKMLASQLENAEHKHPSGQVNSTAYTDRWIGMEYCGKVKTSQIKKDLVFILVS
jgi:hypothetical protein